MTTDFTLGNYEIDQDSNGDFVIKDENDNVVFQWDSTNGKWVMGSNAPLDISELIDGADVSHTGEIEDINHSTKHEPGGSDEVTDIDIGNSGTNVSAHASRHNQGNADEVSVESLGTGETNTDLAFVPDGSGGVTADGVGGGYTYVQSSQPAGSQGETWYDTDVDIGYHYDGASWVEIAPGNHTNLSNIQSDQHHTKPTSTGNQSGVDSQWHQIASNSSTYDNLSYGANADTSPLASGVRFTTSGGNSEDYEWGYTTFDGESNSGTTTTNDIDETFSVGDKWLKSAYLNQTTSNSTTDKTIYVELITYPQHNHSI